MKQQRNQNSQKREYIRVPQEKKQRLLRMVLLDGNKINFAAKLLDIKYPTAKTIVYQYKKQISKKITYTMGTKMCNYTQRTNGGNVTIISSIGGFTK